MRESLLPAVVFVEIVQQAQVVICCVFQSQTKRSVLEVTFLRKIGCVFQSQTFNLLCVPVTNKEKCVSSHILTK